MTIDRDAALPVHRPPVALLIHHDTWGVHR